MLLLLQITFQGWLDARQHENVLSGEKWTRWLWFLKYRGRDRKEKVKLCLCSFSAQSTLVDSLMGCRLWNGQLQAYPVNWENGPRIRTYSLLKLFWMARLEKASGEVTSCKKHCALFETRNLKNIWGQWESLWDLRLRFISSSFPPFSSLLFPFFFILHPLHCFHSLIFSISHVSTSVSFAPRLSSVVSFPVYMVTYSIAMWQDQVLLTLTPM